VSDVRLLAFYLPQFHPIAENDEWWGPGFTEWTNVAKARPLFRGHDQPRLPADLGFYDLRVPEVRLAQADLARAAGVGGFVYWHYWFGDGRTILERPLNDVVASGEPDFPFCVAWANETWTGIWHGAPDRVLIEQRYPGPDDVRRHADWLRPILGDRRYIRVGGRPLVYVLRPLKLPDPERWCEVMREEAERSGLDGLYLVGEGLGPEALRGFDAGTSRPDLAFDRTRLRQLVRNLRWVHTTFRGPKRVPFAVAASNYAERLDAAGPAAFDRRHPTLLAGWDNTPRSGRLGEVAEGFTPERFAEHVDAVVGRVRHRPATADERIVFLKSWNEWAEGNLVEPDVRWGHSLLDALAASLRPST